MRESEILNDSMLNRAFWTIPSNLSCFYAYDLISGFKLFFAASAWSKQFSSFELFELGEGENETNILSHLSNSKMLRILDAFLLQMYRPFFEKML